MRLRTGYLTAAIAVLAAVLAACSSGSSSGTSSGGTSSTSGNTTSQAPQYGGTLNYLVSGLLSEWDLGLDPATGGAAPSIYEDAIFGQLFRATPSGGIEPVLATGYHVSGGGTVLTISLQPGVKFSDGTPFNAAAVAWNIKRDLATPSTASPVSSWPPLAKANGVTTPDNLTVVLHFSAPYAPLLASLIGSNINHIASPTAVQKMGAKQFQKTPVGAGPFEVETNLVDHQLTLKKNPGYFQKGRPYLDKLEFTTVSDDQTAMESLQSGTGQAAQITTPQLIEEAKGNSKFTTLVTKGSTPTLIQLNTAAPPFNNKLARQAIYYATDSRAIAQHLYNSMFPTSESFLGPGDLFYQPTVPGYPGYDPAKAKQIVSSLGGLDISLFGPNDPLNTETLQALAQMWQQAGHQGDRAPLHARRPDPGILEELAGGASVQWCLGPRHRSTASRSASCRSPRSAGCTTRRSTRCWRRRTRRSTRRSGPPTTTTSPSTSVTRPTRRSSSPPRPSRSPRATCTDPV